MFGLIMPYLQDAAGVAMARTPGTALRSLGGRSRARTPAAATVSAGKTAALTATAAQQRRHKRMRPDASAVSRPDLDDPLFSCSQRMFMDEAEVALRTDANMPGATKSASKPRKRARRAGNADIRSQSGAAEVLSGCGKESGVQTQQAAETLAALLAPRAMGTNAAEAPAAAGRLPTSPPPDDEAPAIQVSHCPDASQSCLIPFLPATNTFES